VSVSAWEWVGLWLPKKGIVPDEGGSPNLIRFSSHCAVADH